MTLVNPEPFYGFKVAIDSASQVNLLHPRFLSNIRESPTSYKGVDSLTSPTEGGQVGDLEGFFECIASENVRVSILCQDDIEKKYKITYIQGESIVVHMEDRDLEFVKKNKLYVADFSDWIQDTDLKHARMPLSLATVESQLSKKELAKAT